MASLRLDNVDKVYPNGQVAARGVNLDIADGEMLVLVGPSGSGKTTLLRIVAGLEPSTAGRVFLGARDVTGLAPRDRDLAMVFQTYALYPDKTVRDNLAFGLRMRGARPEIIAQRVQQVARTLDLETTLDRKPGQLSGGQRQRVALGRAMVREPKAFLLDEPLSNLDAQLRVQTRAELARLHRRLTATMFYVTHDQEEAMTLGDRVAVLRDGMVQQVAAPMDIYRCPANAFVAGFIGSPAMNFFRCVPCREGWPRLKLASFELRLESVNDEVSACGDILLGVRPHDVQRVEPGQEDVIAYVDVIQPLGSEQLIHLRLNSAGTDANVTMVLPPEATVRVDDAVAIRFPRDRLHLFSAASGSRLS
jgi:multiple sugar transport system ATP-binding protein